MRFCITGVRSRGGRDPIDEQQLSRRSQRAAASGRPRHLFCIHRAFGWV